MNERKFRRYKAAKAEARGKDYFANECTARKNTAQRSKVRKLLRRRKASASRFVVLMASPCGKSGKALARADQKRDTKPSKCITYKTMA